MDTRNFFRLGFNAVSVNPMNARHLKHRRLRTAFSWSTSGLAALARICGRSLLSSTFRRRARIYFDSRRSTRLLLHSLLLCGSCKTKTWLKGEPK